ncbi:MAG: adenylate/guanylate cyclase domain-containing protein [Solirubrobacteraceae bacterium]
MSETTRCPECGEGNEPTQRFCGSCGAPLSPTCPACGEANPAGFRFCGACGSALDTEAPPSRDGDPGVGEERRWATVVFADLSGFTALSEHTDPEDLRSMVDRCMSEMAKIVERFGGSVDKVIGDALMAVFGAPVAHEDDPERAVRAALEIQRRASEQADDFGGLRVRVGVNTGDVIFAPVGPESRRQLTVMGDAVNTAARLQAAAPREGVMVGDETHAATARAIAYEAVDPIHARGKEAPLRAWLARAATAAPAERPLSAAPFLGRDAELDLLVRTWTRTTDDLQPRLVTLVGLPGIGKTRLTQELAAHVERTGGRTLRGRALPYGERTAYGAFGQVVKAACDIFATDSAPVAAEKLGHRGDALLPDDDGHEVTTHLSILARLTEDTVEDRQVLFASAQRFLEALGREQPTLLVLEDLQWADQALLDLLEALCVRLAEVSLMLVGVARSEFLDARPSWSRLPANVTIGLEPLTEAHVHELALTLLSGVAHADAVAARVQQAAGGNPLFIEELAGWLAERGPDDAAGLPTNVRAMIAARLDGLPAAERQVIRDAAVVGDVFWQGMLEALGSDGTLAATLDSLERRDLVRRSPVSRIRGDQELAFKHSLIREVAYSTLSKAARAERHAAVARFLEDAAGDPDAYAAILAHHWRHAGDPVKAADYLLTAADQAGRGWAHQEAASLCTQALELIPEDDVARRRRARLRRAVALQAGMHAAYDVPAEEPAPSSGEMSPPVG